MSRSAVRRVLSGVLPPILVLAVGPAQEATARNPIRTSFFNAYPSAAGSRLADLPSISGHCGVCHYDFTGGGPLNPYGLAVEAAIPNYPNNDAGRQQAMHAIENDDSDGDGYTTLVEITDTVHYTNTPTFPGLTPGNVGQVSGVDPNDILAYLVPAVEGDTEPPQVTILVPNGGESWEGGSLQTILWNATDNVEVTAVDLFYRDGADEEWTMIARGLPNTGWHEWFVLNTPTGAARVRGVARDAVSNEGEDASDADFTILIEPGARVPTTLRDFKQPGSQPFDAGRFEDHTACGDCHGGYDPSVEPLFNWKGSMMGQAMRDPLFIATLVIAEQDASSSGDLCLRCHTPTGWLEGRSTPTDGGQLTALDRDGISCDFCHRAVDPYYEEGVSPPQDQEVLAAIDEIPHGFSNGMHVVDWRLDRRGPFGEVAAPHPFLESPFHRSSEFCGTCHDVSNPVFEKVGEGDYAPGPYDQAPETVTSEELLPIERTYSEWLHSGYPAGIYAPEFAGNKPDGIVASCQDCHMRDVEGAGCDDPGAPVRPDLPLHDMMGGNAWVPAILAQVYPDEVDPAALAAAGERAVSMLEKAALLDLALTEDGGAIRADLTVTNQTGHKLPTGYPEGRRIWVHLVARDEDDRVVYESGAYDAPTGQLEHDADLRIYEAKPGLSPGLAGTLGLPAGPSFHFVLNDTIYKDNRIPPIGFTNAAYTTFGGTPVDPDHEGPAPRYADGQHWDQAAYTLPIETRSATATLYYQTTSKEYVEFLRDENRTDDSGQLMYDLWTANGRCPPVAMAADTAFVEPSGLAEAASGSALRLRAGPNPFPGGLAIELATPGPAPVVLELFDLQGRRVRAIDLGTVAGSRQHFWDGRDESGREVRSGIYWLVMRAGERSRTQRVVLVR